MSALNFLNKTFSKIVLDDKTGDKMNEKYEKNYEKNYEKTNKKINKKVNKKDGENSIEEDVKLDENEKLIKFNHGVMIKLRRGFYKGYNGFVLENYPDTVDVKMNYIDYVLVGNGLLKNGMVINTSFGKSTIIEMINNGKYMISYERIARFEKNNVEIKGDKVMIKRGEHKNKIGDLVKINKAKLNIRIDALLREKNVEEDDVFYNDLVLKGGETINVVKVTKEYMEGYDKKNNIIKFQEVDVEKYLPGFKIIRSDKSDTNKEKYESDEKVYVGDEKLYIGDEEENGENVFATDEGEDGGEGEVMGYEENTNENGDNYENENGNMIEEDELKVSFKDMERCEFVAKTLSKEENDIMNNIDKVIKFLSYPCDIINKYSLMEKIMDSLKIMKGDLERVKINRWKKSDIKYVVLYLTIIEVVKYRDINITYNTFTNQIEKLYKVGYLTKSDILGSNFLINENIKDTCFSCIILSDEESKNVRTLYKEKRFLEIIIKMVEKCGDILQKWFGKIDLKGIKRLDIKIYNVADGKRNKEYPKYFLTTKDILSGNIPVTSKKIIWGPQSEYLVNIWKNSLNNKMKKCDDNESRSIYEYVINNFDKAPFMRDYVPKNDIEKVKYKELMVTFVKFVDQLREYVNIKNSEKQCELDKRNEEKEKVNNKRSMLSEFRNLEDDLDGLNLDEKKITKKIRRNF